MAEDARNDKVSPEAARSQYGVVLDPETLAVDEPATAGLRQQMTGSGLDF